MTNQISVIKIGDKIKSYKPEINNILSATDGDIYQVRSKDDINAVIGKIYGTPKWENFTAKICSGEIYDENSQKIRAWYFWNSLLSKIRSESGWQKVAEIQTYIAKKYNIVNQFNSFIALETIKQQEDLERYSNEESKYDATYNNNEWWIGGNIRKWIVIWSNVPEIILMSEMSTKSTGINFGGDNISQSTQWSSRYNDYYPERYNDQFNGKTELSLFWLLMFLVYLVEFYGLMAFVVNYVKSKPETKI